ncbi:unnamed protein product [Thelazia callipaeda]|uniref:POU domain protein n=1 Tax=Thelazia callipaeda TaxID=103827 RepID=A0A158RCG8_THECL|nr:unnamed protein product [Thelazia callipaeda]
MQHEKNTAGTASFSATPITYNAFVQQAQSSSGSTLLPNRLVHSKSSELLNTSGEVSESVQKESLPQQQLQQSNDATQQLIAHLTSNLSSNQQIAHMVTPQQIYIAAAEEAKLLETRKQLFQGLQQQLSNNKVGTSSNGSTANAAVAAQFWLQQQLQQQQQQMTSKTSGNQSQQGTNLIPGSQELSFLTSEQKLLAAELRLAAEQRESLALLDSKTSAIHTQSSTLVLGADGSSAFRHPQRQYLVDQQQITENQVYHEATAENMLDNSSTSTFVTSSASASIHVPSLPRNSHVTCIEIENHNDGVNDAWMEPKLVTDDVEMTSEKYESMETMSQSKSPNTNSKEEKNVTQQALLTTENASGIIGISSYTAKFGAVIVSTTDDATVMEKNSICNEQPRMKSILDFVHGDEMEVDVSKKESDVEENETVGKPASSTGDGTENGIAEDTDDGLVIETSETDSGTPLEQTRFAAMRIEERILNEKLGLLTTSSTTTSSSVISNSPQRSTPQSVPPAPSPRSDSVPSTPSSSSFCRAPGLGPVQSADVNAPSGVPFPLVCNICGFSCNSKFHYNSHMNTHGDHQCTMCDYTSRTEGRLKKHMRDSHTVEEQLAAGLDVEQVLASGVTPTSNASTTRVSVDGSFLSTSMASVLEAANLAAAAQAAAHAAAAVAASSSSGSSNAPLTTSAPSDSGSGLSLPSASETPPSNDTVASSSSPSGLAASSAIGTIPPSALDQIRAFTENPSVLPDLSSASLATALISQSLLGSQAFQESFKTLSESHEPSTSPVNGEKPKQCSSKPKTYKCKQCNHVSASKDEQWTHARTHIPVEKQLGCTRCGFVTEYKHHLEYHLRNHMGSKPFHCKKCAYSCVNKSMLNSHMKSHTNIYQFRCRDCTYATKYCHSLKLHLRKYNHNRATDIIDSAVSIAANAAAAVADNSNDLCDGLTDSDDTTMRRLSESLTSSQSVGDDPSPEPLATTSNIAQDIGSALGMTNVVTNDSLNIASHLLLRQQHQMKEMELLLRLKNMTGINPNALLGIPLQCPECAYQAISHEDSLRHHLGHLISANTENSLLSLYSMFGMPSQVSPVGLPNRTQFATSSSNIGEQMEQVDEESEISKVEVDDCTSSGEVDEKPSIGGDSEDHIMSDISGESQDSPSSGKSSIDEGSSIIEADIDKGAKKRKAGLKLNQIAARLHEKNSPDNAHYSDGVNDTKCDESSASSDLKDHVSDASGNSVSVGADSHGAEAATASLSGLPSSTSSIAAPQLRVLPPLGIHNDLINLSNLNIFQQACIAHMQDMERKLHILELWRFSCGHCKMAFQDEPLYHIHMGYHGYENPFKCNRCGQACSDFLTFNLHLLQAKH